MRLYQQIVVYFVPILGNMQVVSILILMIRFYWFTRHLKAKANSKRQPHRARSKPLGSGVNAARDNGDNASLDLKQPFSRAHQIRSGRGEDESERSDARENTHRASVPLDTKDAFDTNVLEQKESHSPPSPSTPPGPGKLRKSTTLAAFTSDEPPPTPSHITFAPEVVHPARHNTPSDNRQFDPHQYNDDDDDDAVSEKRGRGLASPYSPRAPPGHALVRTMSNEAHEASMRYRNRQRGQSPDRISFHRVVSNVFVLGGDDAVPGVAGVSLQRARTNSTSRERSRSRSRHRKQSRVERLKLSAHAIMGRNSNFVNLSEEDRDRLGGIEYRSLKLLLKIVLSYYVSMHLFGIICLAPWIHRTHASRYREYLASMGVDKTWWFVL